jgi:CHAT domain-containing protein/tetratricopeptide (TPR) repeat protein
MLPAKTLFSIALLIVVFRVSASATTLNDQKNAETRQAMARAESSRTNWTEAALRQALEDYDNAYSIWTSSSDFANASKAALESGDIHFLFSKYAEALKRYKNAENTATKSGDWLTQARALSRMGRLHTYLGDNDLALEQVNKALDIFKQHDADRSAAVSNAYGEALTDLAEVTYEMGNFVKSSKHLENALKFFQNDPKGEAKVHLLTGYIRGGIGDSEKAVAELSRALDLYREANDRSGEGLALTGLGLVHSFNRDDTAAIKLHRDAIKIFHAIGDRHSEAIALNALGQAYENLSDYQLALNNYMQALQIFQDDGALDGVSVSTYMIARIYHLQENFDQAVAYYERCLKLSRAAGKARTEVNALNEIARIYAFQGRHDLAAKQYQVVERFYERNGDQRNRALALNTYGDSLFQQKQIPRALDAYSRALPIIEKIGDKGILITTLYNLARANLASDDPEVALPFIKRSLKIIEDLRANVASPEFRISYFSGVRQHYELCIEILRRLDRLHPGQGFEAEAFLVSEKSRARLLLDLVRESRASIREGAAKPLLDRERELKGLIRTQAQYRLELSSTGRDATELAEVENQLAQLRAQYQDIEAQLRQRNPYLASLEQLAPLTLEQIQKELRDDTMLLEFSLGDERSYLWAITSSSIRTYELPARKIIEGDARDLLALITARQGIEGQSPNEYQAKIETSEHLYYEKASSLSRILFGQLADQLGNKRLIVVPEGALQYVPFEALPAPVNSKTLLLETNEVIVEPSFSALIAIRNSIVRHASSRAKLLAVIADPVLSRDDERVHSDPLTALAASSPEPFEAVTRAGGLTRLAHAAEEADAISTVAPWGSTMVAKGFDASREIAMSPNIGEYQIVHFATHGVLDSEHPELSGIVLTMVDPKGVRTNGLMPLHDIYSLDLSAELTVLSACQTALGKDIKGEGLVGLTHAFMSAGAKSVVASLWKVDDRATAVLMAHFYEAMLQQGMSPAAALRSAKLKMMQDKQWNAPYYWAGFVLQGEYTNRISVDHPWLNTRAVVLSLLTLIVVTGLLIIHKRKRPMSPRQSN